MFVYSLIFLFLIKLRFRNQSIVQIITNRYGASFLKTFRNLERIDLRLRKAKCDLEFLQNCNTNNVIPNFLNFKLSTRNFRCDADYRKYQQKLLKKEIENKFLDIDVLRENKLEIYTLFASICSFLDRNNFLNVIARTNDLEITKTKDRHSRKLFNLGIRTNYESLSVNKVIFN